MTIAVLAPGAMGAAIGARLVERGARVLTSTLGRSPESVARARAAGMVAANDGAVAAADIVLSIVPPAQAVAVAERFAPVLAEAAATSQPGTGPVYVDCNAIDVRSVERVALIVARTGARFADGSIIGGPPKPGDDGPRLYVSGDHSGRLSVLRDLGLDVRTIEGPVGAASALKMSYAGITKGLAALAATMALAATRAGVDDALRDELAQSQPQLSARFAKAIPDMLPKAWRWAGEMREISAFLEADANAAAIFGAMAGVYDRLAADNGEAEVLAGFFAPR